MPPLAIGRFSLHDARRMARLLFVGLTAALATACTGDTLSAGWNDAASAATPAPTTRATLSALIDSFGMDADNLYFTAEDGSLYRLARTGSAPPSVIAPAAVTGSLYTEGLAMDDDNLYWTALGDGVCTGAVLRVAKSGGSPVALALNQARPTGIAVDDTTVYWSNQGAPGPDRPSNGLHPSSPPSIMSAPKGGGAATVLVASPVSPDALTLDATGVIWHEPYAIRRVPKGGGAPTTLTQDAIPWESSNLVVSGGTLYWAADQSGWSLQSVAIGGGAVVTLAGSIDAPGGLLVDGSSLLWDVAGGQSVGAIDSEPVSGGSPTSQATPPDLVHDGGDPVASFFLADPKAFCWVESWQGPGLTVAIRVLARPTNGQDP
jgi:hypothetical protein